MVRRCEGIRGRRVAEGFGCYISLVPEPRKLILTTYSVIGLGVLGYLVYVVWNSDGGMGLIMLPVIGMILFSCAIWPLTVLFLVMFWKRRHELRHILYPWLIASTAFTAAAIAVWA